MTSVKIHPAAITPHKTRTTILRVELSPAMMSLVYSANINSEATTITALNHTV